MGKSPQRSNKPREGLVRRPVYAGREISVQEWLATRCSVYAELRDKKNGTPEDIISGLRCSIWYLI